MDAQEDAEAEWRREPCDYVLMCRQRMARTRIGTESNRVKYADVRRAHQTSDEHRRQARVLRV